MNKELYKKTYEHPVKITSIESKEEDSISINYEGGSINIVTYHEDDCCEHVYSDTSVMKYFIESLKEKEMKQVAIKGVPEMGFLLSINHQWDDWTKIFIPCYNFQNGYYSNNLSLKISSEEGVSEIIDITDMVEDNID
jgi:hypothetical protein